MILTAAILIIFSVYFLVLTRYCPGMQKWAYEFHAYTRIYSTVGYRFGRNGSRLDATVDIAYGNGYNGHKDHPFKRIIKCHVNIYIYTNSIKIDHQRQIVESHVPN